LQKNFYLKGSILYTISTLYIIKVYLYFLLNNVKYTFRENLVRNSKFWRSTCILSFCIYFVFLLFGRLAQSVVTLRNIAWVIRFCAVSYWRLKVGVASTLAINLPGLTQKKGIDIAWLIPTIVHPDLLI